jgi:hypothetical protein
MNAGVRLVQSYLFLNGYFTVSELPVIRQLRGGGFQEVTDLDLLALRFPGAEYVVPRGRPVTRDDLRLAGDPLLLDGSVLVDVLIAEVKEGKARVNDALRSPEALETALRRVGCVPVPLMDATVLGLRQKGEVHLPAGEAGVDVRIRIVAFGDGPPGARNGYVVIPMKHVAEFVSKHLDRYHDVLSPADLGDTALGLLHLLRKLRD